MKKKLLIAGGIILFLAAIALGGWRYRSLNKYQVTQFIGAVEQKDPTMIVVKGKYYNIDHPELQDADQERTVTVLITPETQFTKTIIRPPSEEWIKANGGFFRDTDATKESVPSSLEELPINITVTTTKNIYNRTSFTAASIEYSVFMSPTQ